MRRYQVTTTPVCERFGEIEEDPSELKDLVTRFVFSLFIVKIQSSKYI